MSALLAGLVEGFAEGRNKKIEKEQNEELKKFQIKLFKKQLEETDYRNEAKQRLMDLMSGAGSPVPFKDEQGAAFVDVPGFQAQPEGLSAPGKPMNLTEALADPQGQLAALQSGMFKPEDLRKQNNPGLEVLKALGLTGQPAQSGGAMPVGGTPAGAGGLELTGLKIGPNGEVMPDLARPKFKTEVPSGDGKTMVQLDEYGRPIGMRPTGPAEGANKPLFEAQVDKEKLRAKATLALEGSKQTTTRVSSAIDNAIKNVSYLTAGPVGTATEKIPGSPARDLRAVIDTIRANIGFEELNAMRQASPTGGALGQVSERELGYLQAVLSNLEQSQSPEQLKSNLGLAKQEISESWERVRRAYELDYGSTKKDQKANKPSLNLNKQKVVDFNSLPK